jgi:hypothetical protein
MIRTAKQLTRFKPGVRVKVADGKYVGPNGYLHRDRTESWIYRGYQDNCIVLEGLSASRYFIRYEQDGEPRLFEVVK